MSVLAKEIEATYEVLAKMGEGGMGAVYKVRHRFFDELRVIKVMQAQIEGVDELKKRFLGEARRGKLLRHPNLAEVLDFSVAADGTSYMVMEYIEGVNLRQLAALHHGRLDYRTVVTIAEQALAALGFLHSRKFVHRDISPDNLMLIRDGGSQPRIKLIDLGIAKSLEGTSQLTMAGQFIGKVQYASPERFGGQVDARSDLYSLGVVLYELLTGTKPIAGENYFAIMGGHLSRPPRSFAETDPENLVPPVIREALMKALEKRPDDRFQNAEAFAEALRAAFAPGERPEERVPVVTAPANTRPADTETIPMALPATTNRVTTTPEPVTERDRPPESPRAAVATILRELEATEPGTAAGRPVTATVVSPGGARRSASSRLWYAIVAVLLIGGGVVVWLITHNQGTPEPAAVTASNTRASGTSVTVQAAKTAVPSVVQRLEAGQLLINALPWGEVTSVLDASGVERLTGTAETPLVLSLPPGDYKVRLTNPNSNRSVVLDATVKSAALSRCEAELDPIDAAAYVDQIGIGR
jgi:eukaryotic-like serine/threonine-protein kinase